MSWRYARICLLAVIMYGFEAAWRWLYASKHQLHPPAAIFIDARDPETALAIGARIPLGCADLWSLQLINGVSDTLGIELIRKRDEICAAAENMSIEQSLLLAKGVGETTSKKLSRYLLCSRNCEDTVK